MKKRRFSPIEFAIFLGPMCALGFASWHYWSQSRPSQPAKPIFPPQYHVKVVNIKGLIGVSGVSPRGELWGTLRSSKGVEWFRTSEGQVQKVGLSDKCSVSFMDCNGNLYGTYSRREGGSRGFRWRNGKIDIIPTLGGPNIEIRMVSDKGEIVGTAQTTELNPQDKLPVWHAFLWQDGVMYNLHPDNGDFSEAKDISLKSEVLVSSRSGYTVWKDGEFSPLGNLKAAGRYFSGRMYGNAREGYYVWHQGQHKYVVSPDRDTKDLFINDINESGVAVGQSSKISNPLSSFACVYIDAQMFSLNTLLAANPGCNLKGAFDINERGQILCVGNLNGQRRSFLLTPLPRQISQQKPLKTRRQLPYEKKQTSHKLS